MTLGKSTALGSILITGHASTNVSVLAFNLQINIYENYL
jgi:hypothetical protein